MREIADHLEKLGSWIIAWTTGTLRSNNAVNLALEKVRKKVKEPTSHHWTNTDYKAIMIKDVDKIINSLKI